MKNWSFLKWSMHPLVPSESEASLPSAGGPELLGGGEEHLGLVYAPL